MPKFPHMFLLVALCDNSEHVFQLFATEVLIILIKESF